MVDPGSAILIGSGISAGIGFLGSALGGLFNSSSASAANKKSIDMAWQQMAWQDKRDRRAYDWQINMMEHQNQMNVDNYYRQLKDQERLIGAERAWQEKINSPAYQAQQMRAAGMNPAGAGMGDFGGTGTFSPPSIQSPSASAPPMSSSPNGFVAQQPNHSPLEALSTLGGFLKDVAQANLDSAQKDRVSSLLLGEIEGQALDNLSKSYNNFVNSKTIPARIQQAFNESYKEYVIGLFTGEQAKTEQFKQTLLAHQSDLTSADLEKALIITNNMQDIFDLTKREKKASIGLMGAQSIQARSVADLNRAKKETIDNLREWQTEFAKWESKREKNQFTLEDSTYQSRMNKIVNESIASNYMPDAMKEALTAAKKRNDWYEVNEILGIFDTGVKAYGTYKGAKTGQGIVDAQDVRNDIQRDFFEYQKNRSHPKTLHVEY